MQDFIYYNPVKMFFGEDQLTAVIEEMKRYGSKVLLVMGGESFVRNGNYQPLADALDDAGFTRYGLRGNRTPLLSATRRGIELCKERHVDMVLGIGGGVCMDMAKTIAFGAKHSEDIWEYLTYQIEADSSDHLPVGTISTLPSSGPDMNGSTQITDDEAGKQAGPVNVYPTFTWLNPQYTADLPVHALAQGQITSFVHVSITYLGMERAPLAESMALLLLNSIRDGLRQVFKNPHDRDVRANLMLASALNVSGLTELGKKGDWSIYPLEGIIQNYYGVRYQQAITVLFPYWVKQCYAGQQIFKDYFHNVFGVHIDERGDEDILRDGLHAIFNLYREFDLPTSFSQIKERPEDLAALRKAIELVGDQPSTYGFTFDKACTQRMMLEATSGLHE